MIKKLFVLSLAYHFLQPPGDVNGVQLITQYPVTTYVEKSKKKAYSLKDTITIYYYQRYILYVLRGVSQFSDDAPVKGTESFFIYQQGQKKGQAFSSLDHWQDGSIVPVDSFLISRGKKTKDFEPPPDSAWKLTRRQTNATSVTEWWAPRRSPGKDDLDSISLLYDKQYNNIPYSFSAKMDSTYNMKLRKTRLIYNKKRTQNGPETPSREFLFELRKLPFRPPSAILLFFKDYEKNK